MFKEINQQDNNFQGILVKVSLISLLSLIVIRVEVQICFSHALDQPITISDNFNMIEVGGIEVNASDIIVEEEYAFIIEQKSILVYNTEDKSTPILLANYTDEIMNLSSIKKSNSNIFVCGKNLFIFKFVNNELIFISQSELIIGPYNNTMEKCTIDIYGDVVIITSRQGFVLMDITNLTSPHKISEEYLGGYFHKYISGGVFYNNYVLVSEIEIWDNPSRILIYNITNNFQPEYITSFQGTHLSLRDEFAYVILEDFLCRYDLSNLPNPWMDNFAGGLYGEEIDLNLYYEYVIVLMLDYQWTINFYNIGCYPFQKVTDFEVGVQYYKLYIGNDFGYFLSDNGIDIFQLIYKTDTSSLSFYSSFLILFIVFPLLLFQNKQQYKRNKK